MIPLWFVLALGAAFSISAQPLIQEKFKADGFALALWNKIVVACVLLPFVLTFGMPEDWRFYAYIMATSVIYAISDVVYFRAVPVIGSGLMTRLIPSSAVINFFLWFIVSPSTLQNYIDPWYKGVGILMVLALFLYSAIHIKKCQVSWQGVLRIWPVIISACIGGVLTKMSLGYATDTTQAPFAYILVQSALMSFFLFIYYIARKPVTKQVMLARNTLQTAIIMGLVSCLPIFLKLKAIQLADNPGLVSMIVITDSFWILLVYKLIGKKEEANIWAGIGIVVSAMLLVLIKSL